MAKLTMATVSDLLALARQIWGPDRLTLDQIVVRLAVTVGDLARLARRADKDPSGETAYRELQKEMGNLIFSAIRWCDDLGLDPNDCVRAAVEAQERFVQQNTRR